MTFNLAFKKMLSSSPVAINPLVKIFLYEPEGSPLAVLNKSQIACLKQKSDDDIYALFKAPTFDDEQKTNLLKAAHRLNEYIEDKTSELPQNIPQKLKAMLAGAFGFSKDVTKHFNMAELAYWYSVRQKIDGTAIVKDIFCGVKPTISVLQMLIFFASGSSANEITIQMGHPLEASIFLQLGLFLEPSDLKDSKVILRNVTWFSQAPKTFIFEYEQGSKKPLVEKRFGFVFGDPSKKPLAWLEYLETNGSILVVDETSSNGSEARRAVNLFTNIDIFPDRKSPAHTLHQVATWFYMETSPFTLFSHFVCTDSDGKVKYSAEQLFLALTGIKSIMGASTLVYDQIIESKYPITLPDIYTAARRFMGSIDDHDLVKKIIDVALHFQTIKPHLLSTVVEQQRFMLAGALGFKQSVAENSNMAELVYWYSLQQMLLSRGDIETISCSIPFYQGDEGKISERTISKLQLIAMLVLIASKSPKDVVTIYVKGGFDHQSISHLLQMSEGTTHADRDFEYGHEMSSEVHTEQPVHTVTFENTVTIFNDTPKTFVITNNPCPGKVDVLFQEHSTLLEEETFDQILSSCLNPQGALVTLTASDASPLENSYMKKYEIIDREVDFLMDSYQLFLEASKLLNIKAYYPADASIRFSHISFPPKA
jgi:hypothetical protein